jgi:hypothetical protein
LRPREVQVGLQKTLVLDWLGAPTPAAAAAPKDGWAKKSLRLLRQALMGVLADVGKEMQPWGNGPTVRAVDLEVLRGQFYKLHPAADAIEAQDKHQARRKAFRRTIDDAQASNLIGVRDLEGVTYVWLIAPGT